MKTFQNSLEALAQVAARATGARSYAFFEKGSTEKGSATRIGPGLPAIAEYPLRIDGAIVASVVFTFGGDAEAQRARPRLASIAAAMQAIWSAAVENRYAHLADRVCGLEARLIDSKIADRAQGLLTDELNSDPIQTICAHVDGVLRPTSTGRFLEQVLSELEDEIEERRLVAQAKQVLQAVDRLSEEQAHHHLRLLSRKSRKPLKDVARRIIGDNFLVKGKTA